VVPKRVFWCLGGGRTYSNGVNGKKPEERLTCKGKGARLEPGKKGEKKQGVQSIRTGSFIFKKRDGGGTLLGKQREGGEGQKETAKPWGAFFSISGREKNLKKKSALRGSTHEGIGLVKKKRRAIRTEEGRKKRSAKRKKGVHGQRKEESLGGGRKVAIGPGRTGEKNSKVRGWGEDTS